MIGRIAISACAAVFIALAVTGCWDNNNLVGQKIINGISLDALEGGNIRGVVRALRLKSKGSGQFEVKDELVQADGRSVIEVGTKLDSMLAGNIVGSKTHILVIGEQLAKQGIYPYLEPFYRSPRLYLGAKLLISEGKASDILSFDKLERSPISFDILQMLQGAARTTIIQEQTLYTAWNKLFDVGRDTVVPLIKKKGTEDLVTSGMGLFRGDKYTGFNVQREDSTMLLLLMDKLGTQAIMNVKVESGAISGDLVSGVVSYNIRKIKRRMRVSVDEASKEIVCVVKLEVYGELTSSPFPPDERHQDRISEAISADLNDRARSVMRLLLQARCDALGVGNLVSASHRRFWKELDWNEAYGQVDMQPEVVVHVIGTGVLK
ncbi:Ger(x)C family spore germination protein [Cohnella sp. GCM10027633]|uniref:Ger(x)C family spore germination protein n=1 Tax=unclassified Cohnella TaxID=2636738 RepID=UPI003629DC0E